jgi:hypothetical protein
MNTKHTPEPWSVRPEKDSAFFGVRHTLHKFTTLGHCQIRVDYTPESIANASRIVACVNACAGIDDPAKEIATHRARIAELEQATPTTEPTTVLGWLERLPDGYRERAIGQCDKPDERCVSMIVAIDGFKLWNKTDEGEDFWIAVHLHYLQGTPLPPLPI